MLNLTTAERLVFARPSGGRFQIGVVSATELWSFIQDTPDKPEAGGVLLGRHIANSPDIIVDLVTVPLPGDQRGRFHFFRERRHHQEQIDHAWRESGATCTYLGEWHTHPEQKPTPSPVDLDNWRRKLRVDRFSDPIFFVIVGTAQMRAWEGHKRGQPVSLVQLQRW